MRWDHLRLSEENEGAPLPLLERTALARTFDTPEFRGMTFYEIQARSIINQVPPASRMMFRWTINPYRGCSHACKLLSRRRHPDPHGRRPHPAAARSAAR